MKWTSFHLRLLLLIGPLLCPHFLLPIPLWCSPSTGPTTWPWCRIPSSPRCRVTTSPCSCGCGGAAATSSPPPLRPEATARRRRRSCAALSETVCSITQGQKKEITRPRFSPQDCSGEENVFRASTTAIKVLLRHTRIHLLHLSSQADSRRKAKR